MDAASQEYDVLIVGGGPVALYLAARLAGAGLAVAVLDRRDTPDAEGEWTEPLALHPSALGVLAQLALAEPVVAAGVAIPRLQLSVDGERLPAVEFARLDHRQPIACAVATADLDRLLRARAMAAGVTLADGWIAIGLDSPVAPVAVRALGPNGPATWRTRLLVGCDGRESWLRLELGIAAPGRIYRHSYWLADLPAVDLADHDAHVHLGVDGLAASAPIPGDQRRWLLRLSGRPTTPNADTLRRYIRVRTGQDLPPPVGPIRVLQPETATAVTAHAFDCLLLHSAAHRIASLGCQSLSLGLLNAADLADVIPGALAGRARDLDAWDLRAYRRYQVARRRTEVLMSLCKPGAPRPWRTRLLRLALHTPLVTQLTIP